MILTIIPKAHNCKFFNVRNPQWYWSKQEIKNADGYYEEWKELNDDKGYKHIPAWAYKISFNVINVEDNREAVFPLPLNINREGDEVKLIYNLEDCTHVKFIGEDKIADVVVSNSLIHQYIGAKKEGYKFYWYFYIKENTDYERISEFIFISEKENSKPEHFVQSNLPVS